MFSYQRERRRGDSLPAEQQYLGVLNEEQRAYLASRCMGVLNQEQQTQAVWKILALTQPQLKVLWDRLLAKSRRSVRHALAKDET